MKSSRSGSYSIDHETRSRHYKELKEAYGVSNLDWSERQKLKATMTPQEWENWQEEQSKADKEFEQEWSALSSSLMEQGQVMLNMRNNNLDAFCSVFQRADRILTGLSNVEVGVYDQIDHSDPAPEVPAWSDGKSITFNVRAMRDVNEETLTSLHGLNYHEVGHLLYTPRLGSELGAWVKTEGTPIYEAVWNEQETRWENHTAKGDVRIRYAFNLLEDFRAEGYLITKYPSTAPFLQAVVAEYAIDNMTQDEIESVFILLAGRPHMGKELIAKTAQAYSRKHGEDKTRQLYLLANEYRTLVFPRDYARAKEIIKLIANVLPAMPQLPSGCGDRPVLRNGRVSGEKEQQSVAGNMEQGLSKEELNKLFDDLMSGKQDPATGEQEERQDGKGTGQSNSGGQEEGGKPASTTARNSVSDNLVEALEEAVKKVAENPEVQKKIAETNKAIRKQTSTKSFLPRQPRTPQDPKLSDVTAIRSFVSELERLRIDSDPDWDREKPTGKLNVMRAMQADVNDINKLFDRWTTGNDDYDIEACILIDRSGSMYSNIEATCRASWIIKRSLEKINASVSVTTFNDTSRLLYSAEEKSTSQYASVQASGGTDPFYALQEAERVMGNSRRKTKLLFLLTDGQFYGGKSDEIIQNLKANGVYTSLVFLAESSGWIEWGTENAEQISHGCHSLRIIQKPLDLVKVAKDVVRHHVKHALTR